jgi:hypothetical protein
MARPCITPASSPCVLPVAAIGEPRLDRSDDRVARLDAMCIELVGHTPRIQRKDGLEDAFVFLHRFVNAFG